MRNVTPEVIDAIPRAVSVKRVVANPMTLNSARLIIVMEPKQKVICRQKLANLQPDRVVLLSEVAGEGEKLFPDPYNELTGDKEHNNQVYKESASRLKEWLLNSLPKIKARLSDPAED